MARDILTPVALATNNGIAEGAGTTIVVANGATIPASAGGDTRRLLLRVNNTTVSAKILTVRAGIYPPGFRSGMGDLAISIPASSIAYFVLEGARFEQADGSINIDFEAAMTGTVWALQMPKDI